MKLFLFPRSQGLLFLVTLSVCVCVCVCGEGGGGACKKEPWEWISVVIFQIVT